MTKIQLFCFPYAGGSSTIFTGWPEKLSSKIELIPVELAGRGKRIHDKLYDDFEELIDDVYNIVREKIKGKYALFGHSLGGMVVYELARKIYSTPDISNPSHLFFSGRGAPRILDDDDKDDHLLSDEDFKVKIKDLGGTPPQFFEYPELMEMFIPLIRNDFKLAAIDLSKNSTFDLECDISVFLGKDEELSSEQISSWKDHTNCYCSIYFLKGGHFFIHDEARQICTIIKSTLTI